MSLPRHFRALHKLITPIDKQQGTHHHVHRLLRAYARTDSSGCAKGYHILADALRQWRYIDDRKAPITLILHQIE